MLSVDCRVARADSNAQKRNTLAGSMRHVCCTELRPLRRHLYLRLALQQAQLLYAGCGSSSQLVGV